MSLSVIELSGSPFEIGCGHGEELKEKIEKTWDFYRGIVRADETRIRDLSDLYAGYIKNSLPDIYDEITGIADGSNFELWKIIALNSRTEIIRTINSAPLNECTIAYSSAINVLAQTWDWAEALEDLLSLLSIKIEKTGVKVLTLTEPGIVGKMGINDAGVGVGLTILKAPVPLMGLPIHILLRKCLECRSRKEVQDFLGENPLGTTSSISTIFANEKAYGVEVLGDKALEYTPFEAGDFCHSNHYIAAGGPNAWEVGTDMESSVNRLHRAEQLLSETETPSIESMKCIIQDKEGSTPICHAYKPDSVIGSDGTVCRIILNPNERALEVGMGVNGEYRSYSV